MAIDTSFIQNFLAGAEAGRRAKQQQQALADQAEDRKLEKIILQQKLRQLKIDETIQQREARLKAAQMQEGTPERDLRADQVDPRDALQHTLRQMPVVDVPQPSYAPQQPLRMQPVELPEQNVEGFQLPAMSVRPRTQEELLAAQEAARLAAERTAAYNLPAGASRFVGGQEIAHNPRETQPPRPPSLEQQYFEALGKGDQATAAAVLKAIKDTTQASAKPPQRDPLMDEMRALRLEQLRAQMSGGADVGPLSDMILGNPDLLDKLPPKDRSTVLRHIASAGGEIENKRLTAINTMIASAEDTIHKLQTLPGFKGAVGARGPTSLFGALSEPLPGTNAATYTAYVDTLKSQLTLPRLEFLRGLGHMSDREFKAISDSVSALNRNMSESAFKAELAKLSETLKAAKDRVAARPKPTPPAAPATGGTKVGDFIVRPKGGG